MRLAVCPAASAYASPERRRRLGAPCPRAQEVLLIRGMLSLALTLLVLTGCTSVGKKQCLVGDWETLGYRDGLNGAQSTALLGHQNTCLKYGVTPDREDYLAGWHAGNLRYCHPDNGFDVGLRGATYGNVCPEHLHSDFRAAYDDGRRLYLAQVEIDRLQHAIAERELRLREVQAELAGITGAVLHPEASAPDLAALVITAKDLAEEKGRLQAEIDELKRELAAKPPVGALSRGR